jgi:purine-nucleoside phosphorylase
MAEIPPPEASEWARSEAAAKYIMRRIPTGTKIDAAIVLGSGLGKLAEKVTNPVVIPYSTMTSVVSDFPQSTVVGHAGNFVIGQLGTRTVIVQSGRWHFYEGHHMKNVVLAIRIFFHLGVKKLIITNAAGGLNPNFKPGQLMLITDHINLLGANPLFGPNDERFGARFPDMTHAYTPRLQQLARDSARSLKLGDMFVEGVYIAVRGPTFETPAETRMQRTLGADAAGMSTVPEVIVASHQKMDVLGISCITNMCSGLSATVSHDRVQETAAQASENFIKLIYSVTQHI